MSRLIFGMPLIRPPRPAADDRVSNYLRFLLVPLSFMVVFYTGYFLLIERCTLHPSDRPFLGGNALLIAAVIVGLHLFRYVLPPDAQHPPATAAAGRVPRTRRVAVRYAAINFWQR